MDFSDFRATTEALVRRGEFAEAKRQLAKISLKSVPRKYADDLANLARRAGRLDLALKLLLPIVRPEGPIAKVATPKERANYAVSLLRAGAYGEAQEILQQTSAEVPEVQLYLGFAFATRWEYAAAIPHFRKYLRFSDLTPYQRIVAKVNLLAATLATGDLAGADQLIDEITPQTRSNDWRLLHLNTLELSAQSAIQKRDWSEARRILRDAQLIDPVSDPSESKDTLLIRKWQAVVGVLERPTSAALTKLEEVRREAAARQHWETLRDCDYYRASVTRDEDLFLNVYFGTPYASYRSKILAGSESWLVVPSQHVRRLGRAPADVVPERVFDLHRGSEIGGGARTDAGADAGPAALPPGRSLHAAVKMLASDAYRPFLIGSLHAAVFPGDYFNPHTSPGRVAYLLARLRGWLKEHAIPLAVIKTPAGYQLAGQVDQRLYGLLQTRDLRSARGSHESFALQLERLKQAWPYRSFASSQASVSLHISERQARKLLSWAKAQKKLRSHGTGRATLYSFAR